jgi:hypothetical protein
VDLPDVYAQALDNTSKIRRSARRITPAFVLVLTLIAPSAALATGPSCAGCEVGIGVGETYHFWSSTDGTVIPLTVLWSEGRNEFGLFRMATGQRMMNARVPLKLRTTEPYWGVTVTHRWWLIRRPSWNLFFGFGGAYKPVNDELSSTHFNFAETFGVRIPLEARGATLELSMRHWSNGGIRRPNHGQDFATLGVTWPVGRR